MNSETPEKPAALSETVLWWAGVTGLLLLAHAKIEWFYFVLRESPLSAWVDPTLIGHNGLLVDRVITPIRGITFLLSCFLVVRPLVQDIGIAERLAPNPQGWSRPLQVILVFLMLCVLFTPGTLNGLANEYSNSSLVFFTKTSTVNFHQRYLMPALANVLFFRGDFWFAVFSFLCSLLLVFVVRLWFDQNHIPVAWWQLLSLGTTSFIYFQISAPGYPDVLVHLFIVLAFAFPLGTRAKLSLFALSLAAHEASLIIWLSLAWILFDRKAWIQVLMIGGIYIFFWSLADRGLLTILGFRENSAMSSLEWVWRHPRQELLGIFFAFKGLWVLVIAALWHLRSRRSYKQAAQIGLLLAAGLLMTFLGLDSSRLFGWAFMAILLSWQLLASLDNSRWTRFVHVVLAINLLIPPIYVQLNFPPTVRPGLYQTIIDFVSTALVH